MAAPKTAPSKTEEAVGTANEAYFKHLNEAKAAQAKADEIKGAAVAQLTEQGASIVVSLGALGEKYTFAKAIRKARGPNKPKDTFAAEVPAVTLADM